MRQYAGNPAFYPSTIGLIDDSDAPNASNFDVAGQGLADRTETLLAQLNAFSTSITAQLATTNANLAALQAHFNQLLNKPFMIAAYRRIVSTNDQGTSWASNGAFQTASDTAYAVLSSATDNLFAGGTGTIPTALGDVLDVSMSGQFIFSGGAAVVSVTLGAIVNGSNTGGLLGAMFASNSAERVPFNIRFPYAVTTAGTLDFALMFTTSSATNTSVSLQGGAEIQAYQYRVQT